MSDLASQPLEDTSDTPLTLAERRANYEDWLQSGRRTAMPAHTSRVDDLEAKIDLRAKAEGDSASKLLHELAPGTIARTDEGDGDKVELADDVRLGFAQTLLAKAQGADAATAERIANAANAILGPAIARADDAKQDAADDATNVKNQVLAPTGSPTTTSPGPSTAAKDDDSPLAEVLAALDGFGKRLDALEKKPAAADDDDDDDGDTEEEGVPKQASDEDVYAKMRARSLKVRMSKDKAGRAAFDSMHTDHLFFPFQAKADEVYGVLGSQAPKPMHGERRDNYRRRLLTPLQRFSETFKDADLRVAQVDPVAFDAIEKDIYKAAADAYKNPATVPLGRLREHVEHRNGHTYTKFYGRPISWMNQFAPTGRRVRRIIERGDSGANRTLYERV